MTIINNYFNWFSCFILLLTFVFSPGWASQTYLEGKVVCAQSGLPLDSVRVASVLHPVVAWTRKDGSFLLPDDDASNCQPETLSVDSLGEYIVHINRSENRIKIIRGKQQTISVALFDAQGRMVTQTSSLQSHLHFPTNELPAGMYILCASGLKPQRILVIDNNGRGFLEKKTCIIRNILVHECPAVDTVYFCKEGYGSFAGSIDKVSGFTIVKLLKKRWVVSDIHNHTVLTDGSFIQDSLLVHAFNEGKLDVYVNSEHGGEFYNDTAGISIVDNPSRDIFAPRVDNNCCIPRWYTLINQSWPKILGQRKRYPAKTLLQGLEWNCPGHEHASVGFVDNADQPSAIADFEYRFDFNEHDTGRSYLTKNNASIHSNALIALEWLQRNYPASSYCFINHPSREAIGPYSVDALRDFHTAAPSVCLGFEGMPGHQKDPMRGSYGRTDKVRNRTWGGADYILACVGGIWDALLGEGRHFWTIVDSDFHTTTRDFWPGVYEKTWTAVTDTGARAWLEGMRAGEIFIVHGDLISALEFSFDDGIAMASMGADLSARKSTLALTIRFRHTPVNNHGDAMRVDHIDLISGSITGTIAPSDHDAYYNPANPTTEVIRRFTAADWVIEDGWQVIRATITCLKPTYYRLRGTNLACGAPGEVDVMGNPLMDEDNKNSEQVAWKDLWFYSNPIFVYSNKNH